MFTVKFICSDQELISPAFISVVDTSFEVIVCSTVNCHFSKIWKEQYWCCNQQFKSLSFTRKLTLFLMKFIFFFSKACFFQILSFICLTLYSLSVSHCLAHSIVLEVHFLITSKINYLCFFNQNSLTISSQTFWTVSFYIS